MKNTPHTYTDTHTNTHKHAGTQARMHLKQYKTTKMGLQDTFPCQFFLDALCSGWVSPSIRH